MLLKYVGLLRGMQMQNFNVLSVVNDVNNQLQQATFIILQNNCISELALMYNYNLQNFEILS